MQAKILTLAAITLISSASFARGFRLVPSEPLRSTATIHEAEGRNGILIRQKLRFGPYFTTEVRRGWIRSWSGTTGVPGVFWAEHMRGRQAIRFTLTDGDDTVHAETVSRVKSDDLFVGANRNAVHNVAVNILSIGSARQANNFSARFTPSSGGPEWHLFLDNTAAQLHRRDAAGFLESEAGYYTIVPVWRIRSHKGKVADMPFASAGLELLDEQGRARAAVSLMNNGEVYLDESMDKHKKLLLSAACSALLLQTNLE